MSDLRHAGERRRARLGGRTVVRLAGLLVAAVLASCTAGGRAADDAAPVSTAGGSTRPQLRPPQLDGPARLGPLVSGPAQRPVQAGVELAGRALPTNQWWSAALVGPGSGQLWAVPLTVAVQPGQGIDLRLPKPVAGPDAVIAGLDTPITLVADVIGTTVEDFDAFSVLLSAARRNAEPLRLRVAQGNPALTVEVPAGPIVIDTHRSDAVLDLDRVALRAVDGRRWRVVTDDRLVWRAEGTRIVADAAAATSITFVPTPDEPAADWERMADRLAADPVRATTATMTMRWEAGYAQQQLTWQRDRPGGVVAVAANQWDLLDPAPAVVGTYPTPLGPLRLVEADQLVLRAPIAGFVAGVPDSGLDAAAAEEVRALLAAETPGPLDGGSYYGAKHLARLATLVELDRRLGGGRDDLETALAAGVRAALEHRPDTTDTGWLAYDPTWGGIIAQPAEFGSQDYNDHLFHYGYLIHAAAVVAERDPSFVAEDGPMVDLLIDDLMGTADGASFPEFRSFNAYLGHSFASGFAPFADGNNQESSSEAINGWWAAARWGLAVGRAELVDRAVERYAFEAHSARAYWLGELGIERPEGYVHDTVGIVWGGKIDFATWFDPRPSAVIAIQLLPVNFSSLYRADPDAAMRRFRAAGTDLIWPDIAFMDLALAAPHDALAALRAGPPIDDGNTAAFARYWAASLDAMGPPRADISVDGPYGAAFGPDRRIVLVGVNPTGHPVEVSFRRDGRRIATMQLAAGASRRTIAN